MAGRRRGAARWRVVPLLVPAALALLAFLQAPGLLTFDTKIDLTEDPAGFLARALHLWDAVNGVGGTGHQNYGYLFPMGPFFLLGDAVGLPGWVVQRLWSALLLVAAYEGFRRLTRALVGGPPAVAVVAGLAWALAPRVQTVLGPISAEALPVAVLPWVLLPLVLLGATAPRRAALLSAAAVLCMGAANATLTVAVLPVPVLWVLTRPWPRRQVLRLLGWWSAAVVAATAWWIVPLLLLGRYSPPFLDWIESAESTTSPGLLSALRGTTHWVAQLSQRGEGIWPAATALATDPLLIAATGLVAALGLAGLARSDVPERTFLVLTAVAGLAAITLPHVGAVASPVAPAVRDLLDGVLAPLRNVHKFDPLVRLPLTLGLAHLLVVAAGTADRRRPAWPAWPAPLAVAALVLVTALPALSLQLRPGPGYQQIPDWWREAAAVVAAEPGRTLVVPAAGFGRYTWGRTVDEPLQPLSPGPWAVRNQVPLVVAGAARLLERVETVLASGRGSPALADLLARSGISQVLVRNDLDLLRADTLEPAVVHAALEGSPGLRRTAAIGPLVDPQDRRPGDAGIDVARPALEVYAVDAPVAGARTVPIDRVSVVGGGPEDLLRLLEVGLLAPDEAAVLAGHLPADLPAARGWDWIATDGLQRRERSFGRLVDPLGPVLAPDEPFRQDRAAHDVLPFDAEGHSTQVRYDDLLAVTASSSGSYADGFSGGVPGTEPYRAVDGNALTAWRSSSLSGPVGEWLEVRAAAPLPSSTAGISLVRNDLLGAAVTRVRVETDAGHLDQPLDATGDPQALTLPPGETRRLRVTVLEVEGPPVGDVAIAELVVPGVDTGRTLLLPQDSADAPGPLAFSFAAEADHRDPCLLVLDAVRCDAALGRPAAEPEDFDRTFRTEQRQRLTATGTVLARPGTAVQRLLGTLAPDLEATATSSLGGSLAAGAHAAVDGDPATAWLADPLDPAPALELSWPEPRTVTTVGVRPPVGRLTSLPTVLRAEAGGAAQDVPIGPDGTAVLAPVRTDRLRLSFPVVEERRATVAGSPFSTVLGVGVGEVLLPEVDRPRTGPDPDSPTGAPCGFGPPLVADGRSIATRVTGTLGQLLGSQPLRLEACGPGAELVLAPGEHRVQVGATAEFVPRTLELRPEPQSSAGPDADVRAVTVLHDGAASRELLVAAGPEALLVLPESVNPGWRATLAGRQLTPVTVDGWQLGFVLPAGAGGAVDLVFTPDRPYRLALLLGGAVAAALLAAAVVVLLRPAPTGAEPEGRAPREPAARRRTVAAAVLGAVVVAGLLGGPVGLLALALGGLLRHRTPGAAPVAACLAVLAAVAVVLVDPAGPGQVAVQTSGSVQALCLLALGAALSGRVPATPWLHRPAR